MSNSSVPCLPFDIFLFRMKHTIIYCCWVALLLPTLVFAQPKRDAAYKNAVKILQTTPIVDTHIDFPWSLVERKEWYKPGYTDFALSHPGADFDYVRAKQGGLYGAFMSIYIPSKYQKEGPLRPREMADSLINLINAVAAAHPGKFALAPTAASVEENFKKGIISLPMGMENGAPIAQLSDVAYFHQRGIRYITLTHGRDNHISDSSYDTLGTHGGLSPYGEAVVREMNRVGIMVDVSHLSDRAIEDVLTVAKKPLIASHSACRHFTPGLQRNLPDSLVRAIARTGGVVQVPFSHYFLSTTARTAFNNAETALKKAGLNDESTEGRYFMRKELMQMGVTLKEVVNQIDYLKNLVGIDYVGFGSDFDGVGMALPPDLADVSMYPNLIAELLRRGYTESDIRKVCFGNVIRVWKANE